MDDLATIDTIAVHPDHRRTGLATALIATLVERLRVREVTTLDAWREMTWTPSLGTKHKASKHGSGTCTCTPTLLRKWKRLAPHAVS